MYSWISWEDWAGNDNVNMPSFEVYRNRNFKLNQLNLNYITDKLLQSGIIWKSLINFGSSYCIWIVFSTNFDRIWLKSGYNIQVYVRAAIAQWQNHYTGMQKISASNPTAQPNDCVIMCELNYKNPFNLTRLK